MSDIIVQQIPIEYGATAPLETRVRKYSATITYVAVAAPGTVDTEAKWRIGKIVDDGAGNIDVCFAESNPNADKIFEVTPADEHYRTAYNYYK